GAPDDGGCRRAVPAAAVLAPVPAAGHARLVLTAGGAGGGPGPAGHPQREAGAAAARGGDAQRRRRGPAVRAGDAAGAPAGARARRMSTPVPVWREYLELTEPRVVALLVVTALVGVFLAGPGLPPRREGVRGLVGIWLASSSAEAINHLIDPRIDKVMARTAHRPLATGALRPAQVLVFALALGALSMVVLVLWVNTVTAVLTFASLIGYAVIYTGYLKQIGRASCRERREI